MTDPEVLTAYYSAHRIHVAESASSERVREVISESLPPELSTMLLADLALVPALTFMVDFMTSQCRLETASEQSAVIEVLRSFLRGFGFDAESPDMLALVEAAYKSMTEHEFSPPQNAADTCATTRLAEAVVIGRAITKSVAGGPRDLNAAAVNTNADLDWSELREKAKGERKRRRDDEKKALLMNEYSDFLEARGLTVDGAKSTRAPVRIHSSGGWRADLEIRCEGIRLAMGPRVLLENANLIVQSRRRYGMVGRNGVGKTSLLRRLADGDLEGVSPYLQILHIEQEVAAGEESALEVVLASDVERASLLKQEKEILAGEGDESKLGEIYERLDDIDAHSAESRAASILSGLSFTTEMMNAPTSTFSGGWRMRVALARALFIQPDVLLLDEPTNHLDLHAVLWLENALKSWEGTLVIVSHNRSFLNNVCTDMIHYANKSLTYYRGDYDNFQKVRLEKMRQQASMYEAQEKHKEHMQSFIDKFRFNAKRASMVQSRIKAMDRMSTVMAVADDPAFTFSFPNPEPCPPPVLQAAEVSFGYSKDRILFRDVDFHVDLESRVALVGANGSGKSTFLKCLLNELEPLKGRVLRNPRARIGYFAQHQMEALNLRMTGLEFLRQRFPDSKDESHRAQMSRFGLPAEHHNQPIYTLSGGQKSRIVFACITYNKPHVLLLDEPTNHLDIDTVDALIEAIQAFEGGVVLISHDEHLISSVAEELYVCKDGTLSKFHGDFYAYRNSLDMTK